ncbi:MAG: 3-keto-5-aminohexanoate cleavage protein [Hyphomicrobiales bacterium]|nr:3-keto-5-aminohexanoate cleavage protein [Rickettsiales bacterium]MCP5361398.1 3-keto-5-aminohexanoate cleavage protein [Hyphomicrobiales bacterium]
MQPIIISVAPNGARKTRNDHPALPVTPVQLGEEARACRDAGAALIHLHIRDAAQKHTLDVPTYRAATGSVRQQCGEDFIVQVTSEAVEIYTAPEQMQMVLELQPEAVSLAIREIIPEPAMEKPATAFLKQIHAMGIHPQYILYSPEEVAYFGKLRKAGLIPGERIFVLFVLGKKTGNPEAAVDPSLSWARPEDLDPFLECFDAHLTLSETEWAVCAFGGKELECMEYTAKCGGHVRIGFENNHLMADGSIAPNNAALITQFVGKVRGGNRPIATAAEARKILGM